MAGIHIDVITAIDQASAAAGAAQLEALYGETGRKAPSRYFKC
jgi:hypothetical protein